MIVKHNTLEQIVVVATGRETIVVFQLCSDPKPLGYIVYLIRELFVESTSATKICGSTMAVRLHRASASALLNSCQCSKQKPETRSAVIEKGEVVKPARFEHGKDLQALGPPPALMRFYLSIGFRCRVTKDNTPR